jgi:hypothetical protein
VRLRNNPVYTLVYWLQSAFDFMAMGNYPYPSGYVLNGGGQLPAFPMRVACKHLVRVHPHPTEREAAVEELQDAYPATPAAECVGAGWGHSDCFFANRILLRLHGATENGP